MVADLPTRAPELSGDGILLSPWEDGDLPGIMEIADDAATRTWSGSLAGVRTVEDARRWLVSRRGSDRVDWAVRHPGTRRLVGRAGLGAFRADPPTGEIGYGVHPAHRGRGVATAAVRAVTGWGYAELGLSRIELVHDVGNLASCAVATRSGYLLEGRERANLAYPDGRLHDLHRHARLASDPPGPAAAEPGATLAPGLAPRPLPAEGLVLRPWEPADAPAVLVGLSDPLTARWNPRLPLPDLAAAAAWITDRAVRRAAGRAASWAVCSDGDVVGSVGLRELDQVDGFAVASYWTMPSARGRGVAGRALRAATAYAFDDLGLHRVQLAHALANVGSCRVAEKAGFALEGTLRGSNRLAEGFADEHLHAIVSSDPR